MISFLLEEGVISVAALSGIFTTQMMSSFKSNILDPFTEKVVPSHHLDDKFSKEQFTSNISWKLFLRDFLIWLIIMVILWVIWKKIVSKIQIKKFSN
uniref:Uncharacterized protein n=1 Tax=viral metagenome TaxID=1070528 RepID=A0A6C0I9X7_9ZZZZ